MSHVSSGWYPDPSQRFAQRYHDGTRWTDHVADAAGWSSVDDGGRRPASAADPYGSPQPSVQGGSAQGGQQGHGHPGYGHGGAAAGASSTVSVGLAVAGVGALLVLCSLLELDFMVHGEGIIDDGAPLGDLSGEGAPWPLDLYSSLGLVLGSVVAVGAVVAVLARPAPRQIGEIAKPPWGVAAVCGVFALWHLSALSANHEALREGTDQGFGYSPATGGWVGLVGWLALAAGQLMHRPLRATR